MATTWGQFAITCVRYAKDGYGNRLHISAVGMRRVNAGTPDAKLELWTREQVILLIQSGVRVVTAYWNGSHFRLGDEVEVFRTLAGNSYIRTDGNRIADDNLGSLPEC